MSQLQVSVPRKDIRRSETSNYAWMTTKWSEVNINYDLSYTIIIML